MKIRISNTTNLILSLLAYLPIFVFPFAHGISYTPAIGGLVFLLLCQLFFNRGNQVSGAADPHGKAMEKMSVEALQKFMPITTRGAHAGTGVTGPTQNIQATDSQRGQALSWLVVAGLWFASVIISSDARHGVAAKVDFTAYAPVFVGLAIAAAADVLLASKYGQRRRKLLLAAAICGLLPLWLLILYI